VSPICKTPHDDPDNPPPPFPTPTHRQPPTCTHEANAGWVEVSPVRGGGGRGVFTIGIAEVDRLRRWRAHRFVRTENSLEEEESLPQSKIFRGINEGAVVFRSDQRWCRV